MTCGELARGSCEGASALLKRATLRGLYARLGSHGPRPESSSNSVYECVVSDVLPRESCEWACVALLEPAKDQFEEEGEWERGDSEEVEEREEVEEMEERAEGDTDLGGEEADEFDSEGGDADEAEDDAGDGEGEGRVGELASTRGSIEGALLIGEP